LSFPLDKIGINGGCYRALYDVPKFDIVELYRYNGKWHQRQIMRLLLLLYVI
jgi:hypothetical protein